MQIRSARANRRQHHYRRLTPPPAFAFRRSAGADIIVIPHSDDRPLGRACARTRDNQLKRQQATSRAAMWWVLSMES